MLIPLLYAMHVLWSKAVLKASNFSARQNTIFAGGKINYTFRVGDLHKTARRTFFNGRSRNKMSTLWSFNSEIGKFRGRIRKTNFLAFSTESRLNNLIKCSVCHFLVDKKRNKESPSVIGIHAKCNWQVLITIPVARREAGKLGWNRAANSRYIVSILEIARAKLNKANGLATRRPATPNRDGFSYQLFRRYLLRWNQTKQMR